MNDNEIRNRILDKAGRAFMAHGYKSVSMDRLASDLGTSKRTLYEHFGGKEELLSAVMDVYLEAMERDVTAVVEDDTGTFHERLERLGLAVARHLQGLEGWVIEDIEKGAPRVADAMHRRRRAAVERDFGRFIEQGQEQGLLRDDIPPAVVLQMLVVSVDGLARSGTLARLPVAAADLPSLILQTILYGVVRRDD